MTFSQSKRLNLACGSTYIADKLWVNVDFYPHSLDVIQLNLLNPLPFPDNSFDLVYSSHFIEHVPRHLVSGLMAEWLRVLRPGGILRLVLPDCQEMFSEYLRMREAGNHEHANFVILEIIDQCVRSKPGGLLAEYYQSLANRNYSSHLNLSEYVFNRTGETLEAYILTNHHANSPNKIKWSILAKKEYIKKLFRLLRRIKSAFRTYKFRLGLSLLPKAFIQQNISLAGIGELHKWLWDFHQIQASLIEVGFTNIQRVSYSDSSFYDFPFYPLDIDEHGFPRKGNESMYIEAIKT